MTNTKVAPAPAPALVLSNLRNPTWSSKPLLAAHRRFTTSRPKLASEPPSSNGNGPQFPIPPGFEKLANSPSAMKSIEKLVLLMKQNGVDLTTGERPSMWAMMKLANNKEVKEATAEVMEELKNAGVDVSPERLQAIMKDQNFFGGGKK
ncbi:hypothetical protein IE53DRAFT_309274 [Violaceomyces palustris]|uniref:Uncharacterized protein n=1 Tax=Violaceomyces palustris TaxID=1673888 RepID=A0ACD0P7B6_9BASI|nr:hypothetical protein IE53DRAFT_309274 [Violaceomyces palustris]